MDNIKLGFNCPVGPEHFQQVEGGSYCDLCKKKVYDLKGYAPSEIHRLLDEQPEGVCGSVTLNQLSNSPEEKLVLSAGRPLKVWELWLLALVFCFGVPLSSDAQTHTAADSADGIASVGNRIDQFLADLESQDCGPGHHIYQGVVIRPPSTPDFVWDTMEVKKGNRGLEIIVLRPFLYYSENSLSALGDEPWKRGLSQELAVLANSADSIADFPWKTIHIHGHADLGEAGDLQSLSEKRAEEVAEWLRSWNLPNEIKVKGFGATKPYDGPEGPSKKRNRRVEIIMGEDWNY